MYPCEEAAEAFLAEENHFVEEHNAWCAEERGRLAGVKVRGRAVQVALVVDSLGPWAARKAWCGFSPKQVMERN